MRQTYCNTQTSQQLLQALQKNTVSIIERELGDCIISMDDNTLQFKHTIEEDNSSPIGPHISQLLYIEALAASTCYLIFRRRPTPHHNNEHKANTDHHYSPLASEDHTLYGTQHKNDTIEQINQHTSLYRAKIHKCVGNQADEKLHDHRWTFYHDMLKIAEEYKFTKKDLGLVLSSLSSQLEFDRLACDVYDKEDTPVAKQTFEFYFTLTEAQKTFIASQRQPITPTLQSMLSTDFGTKNDGSINEKFYRGFYTNRVWPGLDNSVIKTIQITDQEPYSIAVAGAPIAIHQKDEALRQTISSQNYQQLINLHVEANGYVNIQAYLDHFHETWGDDTPARFLHLNLLSPIRGQGCLRMSDSNDKRITNMITHASRAHNQAHAASSESKTNNRGIDQHIVNIQPGASLPVINGTTPYNVVASLSKLDVDEIIHHLETLAGPTPSSHDSKNHTHPHAAYLRKKLLQIKSLIAQSPTFNHLITPALAVLAKRTGILLHHSCKSSKDRDKKAQEYEFAIAQLEHEETDIIQQLLDTFAVYSRTPKDDRGQYQMAVDKLKEKMQFIRQLPCNDMTLALSKCGQKSARQNPTPLDPKEKVHCLARCLPNFPLMAGTLTSLVIIPTLIGTILFMKKDKETFHTGAILTISGCAIALLAASCYFRRDITRAFSGVCCKPKNNSSLNNYKNKEKKPHTKTIFGLFAPVSFIILFLVINNALSKYSPEEKFFNADDPDDYKKIGVSLGISLILSTMLNSCNSCHTTRKNQKKRRRSEMQFPRTIGDLNSSQGGGKQDEFITTRPA